MNFCNVPADDSNSSGGVTRHSGDSIDAKFGTTPTIDGVVNADEWGDANSFQFGSQDSITVYFIQNGYGLFIGFDIQDLTRGSTDWSQIGLDTDHDGIASEVDYILSVDRDGSDYQTRIGPDYGITSSEPDGWDAMPSSSSSGWQIEYYITYDLLHINPGIENTIGIAFSVEPNPLIYYTWPSNSDMFNPESYGDIYSSDNWGSLNNIAPLARAEANPTEGVAPLKVQFDGLGEDADGTIVSYYWDFGDGSTSDEQYHLHTFKDPGSYNVVLTVTDDDNAISTDSVSISVTGSSSDGDSNDGSDGDGDNPDSTTNEDKKDTGFMPGFDFISIFLSIFIIIIFLYDRNRGHFA
jgi:PKD repeat protein